MKISIVLALLLFCCSKGFCLKDKYYSCENHKSVALNISTTAVCAINIEKGMSLTMWGASSVLQDFIADCDDIYAVSLQTFGTYDWTKYEILESSAGKPGKVLYSAWINMNSECGVTTNASFFTIPTGDIKVKRGRKYYIRGTQRRGVFSVTITKNDSYKFGRGRGEGAEPGYDLVFIVSSKPIDIPYLKTAIIEEKCKEELTSMKYIPGDLMSKDVCNKEIGD